MAAFTLQSVVLEDVTDRLVDEVGDEIARGQPLQLVERPLMKAQAKDYVRQTQERLMTPDRPNPTLSLASSAYSRRSPTKRKRKRKRLMKSR